MPSNPAQNGCTHDFTTTYPYSSKTSSSNPTYTSTTPALPTFVFTRMTYAKDGRGHVFTEDSYPYATVDVTEVPYSSADSLLSTSDSSNTISKVEFGADGLPRGPYDLGQRVRSLSFFARSSSSVSSESTRSSRTTSRSTFLFGRRDGSMNSKSS